MTKPLRRIAALALLCLPLAASAAASARAPAARPLVPLLDADSVTRVCDAALAQARKSQAAMGAKPGGAGVFEEWNRLSIALEDAINPIYLLGSVHPDKAVRDASEPCLVKFTTLQTELFQDEKLFKRVAGAAPANDVQRKLKKDLLEGFEDSGVALPPDRRARAREIFDRIESLRQEFDRHVRDDPTRVTFTPAEVEGLPESWLKAHEGKRDKDGNYVLDLKYPSYVPFLQGARDGEARKRYYVAKMREGGEPNLALMEQIFVLRKELASLYGLPTFADYALRRKMAGKPETVMKFLADVKGAVNELEKKELEELRAEKAKESGQPLEQVRLERWDVNYFLEKVRRDRFSVDQEKLRRYFPTAQAIDYALLVSSTLYGVRFREVKVPTWHEDVRYFDVLDARTGRFVSGFYLDLFPREGKYGHAAAFPIRGASRLAARTPLSALVANFNREGLDHGELETLMHEFGHVLHGVLSRADYNMQAGTSVKVDFVEAPSQMFEEWARRPETLALFARACPGCPRLSAGEIQRLDSARKYGQGIQYARQWLYAAFDMEMSTNPRPTLAVWKAIESATPLGHVEGTMMPASFSHLTAQYGAGYYGYMWSQVIALDMLSAYKGNLLDPAVGARYRDAILSQGGQREEMDMVRRLLGREPSSDAFFAEITGRR